MLKTLLCKSSLYCCTFNMCSLKFSIVEYFPYLYYNLYIWICFGDIFFHLLLFKVPLTHDMAITQPSFTSSKWNMGEIFGLKFYLWLVYRPQKIFWKSLHAEEGYFCYWICNFLWIRRKWLPYVCSNFKNIPFWASKRRLNHSHIMC